MTKNGWAPRVFKDANDPVTHNTQKNIIWRHILHGYDLPDLWECSVQCLMCVCMPVCMCMCVVRSVHMHVSCIHNFSKNECGSKLKIRTSAPICGAVSRKTENSFFAKTL